MIYLPSFEVPSFVYRTFLCTHLKSETLPYIWGDPYPCTCKRGGPDSAAL
jgi:hypothetical protein